MKLLFWRTCFFVFISPPLLILCALLIINFTPEPVHPDEVKVRKWIARVRGTFVSRLDPKRHITLVNLSNCDITDEDLVRLKALSRLRNLNLSNTNITDGAIPTLIRIDTLVYLDTTNTKITKEGYEQFIDALCERLANKGSQADDSGAKIEIILPRTEE